MKKLFALLGVVFLIAAGPGGDQPGRFDYYVLALSWSPSFCASLNAAQSEPRQCGVDRPYAFVVHGLWPQNERGYPENCTTSQPRTVDPSLSAAMLSLTPSPKLIQHEWERHGLCTGLPQAKYFEATRILRNKVAIPPAYVEPAAPISTTAAKLRASFVKANPAMPGNALAVRCNKTRVSEVWLCFTRAGAYRACSVRDQCSAGQVTMPPVRRGKSTSP
jgi:ribonuclease T2